MARPRASDEAERVDGGYIYRDQFYSEREWQARERRRQQWRERQQRRLADPASRELHRTRVAAYDRSEQGRVGRQRADRKRQQREIAAWLAECQRKYGHLDDDDIKGLILHHEVELRQMRAVLRGRQLERVA